MTRYGHSRKLDTVAEVRQVEVDWVRKQFADHLFPCSFLYIC